jgi:hypothetical protein
VRLCRVGLQNLPAQLLGTNKVARLAAFPR